MGVGVVIIDRKLKLSFTYKSVRTNEDFSLRISCCGITAQGIMSFPFHASLFGRMRRRSSFVPA